MAFNIDDKVYAELQRLYENAQVATDEYTAEGMSDTGLHAVAEMVRYILLLEDCVYGTERYFEAMEAEQQLLREMLVSDLTIS